MARGKTKSLVKSYFEGDPSKGEPQKVEKRQRRILHRGSFYISPEVLDRLENAWLDGRRKDRSVTKSGLVEKFIDEGLKKIEQSAL